MSHFLTSREAAERLRFGSHKSFLNFLSRRRLAGYPVTTYRRGRVLLFKECDLEALMPVERARTSIRKVG